jgi:dihydroflavonol-4-reductase
MIPGGYNWVDVRDVCHAAIRAMDNGKPGECYLLGGNWLSMKNLAMEIHQLGGSKAPGLIIPFWMAGLGVPWMKLIAKITRKEPLYTSVSLRTLNNSHQNISSAKARDTLGFNPRSFHETLSDTLAWFRDNHRL